MTRLTRSLGVRPGGGPLVILVAGLERSDAAEAMLATMTDRISQR
jgi:hypothetical protein